MADVRKQSAFSTERHMSVSEEPVTSVLRPGEIVYDPENPDRKWDADEEVLAALGYRPEFKREFSLFTCFSVSFAVLGLLPSFATTLYYGMGYAGTAGMTWGWVIACSGIMCVSLGMAEICSSMPTSGGLYYASAVLAPPGLGPLASWVTGWSNWLGQITAAPSVDYGTASMILAAASIKNPDYAPSSYQVYLLTALLMVIHCCMSSAPTKWIAWINSVGSTFNMLALIAVIIMIPAATNREDRQLSKFTGATEVWGTLYQGSDWPNGIAVLMSFLSIIWTLSGYDSPFHLSEECSNANVAAPRAIVLTSSIGCTFGWFLQIVVAYTVVDIQAALTDPIGQPWAAYLTQILPTPIAIAVLAITVIAGFSMGQGCMVAASRVTFAYARDGCFPLSKYWKKVNTVTRTPVNAVVVNTFIGLLLLLLIFGGELAVGALFSIGAIAQYVAFTIPIFIRLFLVGNRFRPGPWNLGRLTLPIGGYGCAFVILMVPIMCFPGSRGADLNLQTMNWTCLVYGAPMLLALVWWVVSARKWFKGPKVNLEHVMYGREEQAEALREGKPLVGEKGEKGGGDSGSGRASSEEVVPEKRG